MERLTEKFTIKITDHGAIITDKRGISLEFSAGEALMLLDILRNEEAVLKKMTEEASPLPISIKFRSVSE